MKNLLFISAAILFLAGCTAPTDTKEVDELAKKNIEVVMNLLEAFENEDMEALKELWAEDATLYGPLHDQMDTVVPGDMQVWFDHADSIEFDVTFIMHEVIEEGELAGNWVLLWCFESWFEVEAEKRVTIIWHAPMQIEDGKVVHMTSIWNQWDLYKQLGYELEWDDDDDNEHDDDDDKEHDDDDDKDQDDD